MIKEKPGEQTLYGYARVSFVTQNEDRQVIALLEIGIPAENIYIDKLSGKNFDRPQYKKLLKKLNSKSCLYIKSIDRLGRGYSDLCDQWRIITKDKKADIYVIDMPLLDTRKEKNLIGTLISDLVLVLLSYCAESELSMIHQRQREGIEAAKARGVKIGRPSKPLPDNFRAIYLEWESGGISAIEAAKKCEMPISTLRYKANAYRKSTRQVHGDGSAV